MSQSINIKRIAEEFVAFNIRPTCMKGVDDIVVYEVKEVDCGWVCFWDILPWIEPYRINMSSSGRDIPINEPIMVNRYTYTPSRLEMSCVPNLESAVRNYINSLPLWQQAQNKDLQIHESVEFYPPILHMNGVSVIDDVKDVEFCVRIDTRIYSIDNVRGSLFIENKERADILLQEIVSCGNHVFELRCKVVFNHSGIEKGGGFLYNKIWFHDQSVISSDDSQYGYFMIISGYVSEMIDPFLRRGSEEG